MSATTNPTFNVGDRVTILGGFDDGATGNVSGILTCEGGDGYTYSVMVGDVDLLGLTAARLIAAEANMRADKAGTIAWKLMTKERNR
jgi:hypothetical protein